MLRALDRSITRRLGRTLSAQGYAQLVTLAVQLALVPVLLRAWGTSLYGAWLVLSAVPLYLSFSDFGLTFVAKNAMVIAVAGGRRDEALRIFHTVFALLCALLPPLLMGSAALILLFDPDMLPGLAGVAPGTARAALLLLALNMAAYQLFLLVCAGIRAENRPASEVTWAATARLGEGAATAGAALAGGGLVAAAAAMVAIRLLFLFAAYRWLRGTAGWLALGWRAADRATASALWRPALAYMAMPVGHALLLQGPVLVAGSLLGAGATVAFATTRTVVRLGTAAINMINNSVVSEYAALHGKGARAAASVLFRWHVGATLVATFCYAAAIILLAPAAVALLTHDAVRVAAPFLLWLVLAVVAEMIWSALFSPIAAINRHARLAIGFAALALAGVGAAWLLAPRYGLSGVAGALAAAHLAMVALCLFTGRRRHG
ncbi:teichoic acid transporter [Sphingomonas olei]|uniref:Teichoic acid transporter n=1 Tax=Sphingomonas olei TaxID=1886787 RepID=A0ABY2QM98_9SPHN|nr:teichoic acid transporter [Sphingomonas olei]THG41020.1 teichoic acid transporter [Sphingomonas olei]